MLQNPRKTLGFKKNMVYKIPPGGEVNHIQPVAYCDRRRSPDKINAKSRFSNRVRLLNFIALINLI